MTHRLHASVIHSEILLEIDAGTEARLIIDGAVRVRQQWSRENGDAGFYLATPLQTAYEYHALVEARAVPGSNGGWRLRLSVDGEEVARAETALASGDTSVGHSSAQEATGE